MKRNKGLRFVYQPAYVDRATGEKRLSPTWWISYSQRGKRFRESSHSEKQNDAVKLLKKSLPKWAPRLSPHRLPQS